MSERDQDGQSGDRQREQERTPEPRRAAPRVAGSEDVEAANTDGRGTGGVGADAGGYGPVPGSEADG